VTAVKVCGLTREEDVALACNLGARWLGFNFARASNRRVDLGRARALAAAAPGPAVRVGVFVDETVDEIRRAIEAASLDAVQLHRPLAAADLELPRGVFAVVSVGEGAFAVPPKEDLARCRAVLFDSASGGSGLPFDWSRVDGGSWPVPVLLAGGLTPENVGRAIGRVRPAGVDVASGVESAPGIKDAVKMRQFFRAVEEADARPS
jgi:phosphoribosylanthranilate isomerase